MKKSIILILSIGLLIISCKGPKEVLNGSTQGIVDRQTEEYRIINTWFSRHLAFNPTTLTNYFERGPLDELITEENLINNDLYVTTEKKIGSSRSLGAARIAEFKQKAVALKEVKLNQDLMTGLVTNENRDDKYKSQITFPIISNDGIYAIAYKEEANFGIIYLFRKKGDWEIYARHTVFATPQYE